jgi:hypothetical protein
MTVGELELLVSRLAADEFALFSRWFESFRAQRWDSEIEADIQAGKLDRAGHQRADDDFEFGRCIELNRQRN